MLSLVRRGDEDAFAELAKKIEPSVRSIVRPFAKSSAFCKLEDEDSLHNVGLFKVYEAFQRFEYDDTLSEEHNEKRFLSQMKVYVRHYMIDMLSAARARKRGADVGKFQLNGTSDGDGWVFDLPSAVPPPAKLAEVNELVGIIESKLESAEEKKIFSLITMNCSQGDIAGRMGMTMANVRKVAERVMKRAAAAVC